MCFIACDVCDESIMPDTFPEGELIKHPACEKLRPYVLKLKKEIAEKNKHIHKLEDAITKVFEKYTVDLAFKNEVMIKTEDLEALFKVANCEDIHDVERYYSDRLRYLFLHCAVSELFNRKKEKCSPKSGPYKSIGPLECLEEMNQHSEAIYKLNGWDYSNKLTVDEVVKELAANLSEKDGQ